MAPGGGRQQARNSPTPTGENTSPMEGVITLGFIFLNLGGQPVGMTKIQAKRSTISVNDTCENVTLSGGIAEALDHTCLWYIIDEVIIHPATLA